MKKILFIDMDGVLADYDKGVSEWLETHNDAKVFDANGTLKAEMIHGIFRTLPPIEGSIDAVTQLHRSGKYDMFIATTAPWLNPDAATDKRYWIENYYGDMFTKRMFITHRKDLLMGDYLIDDRTVNGALQFSGELLLFGKNGKYKDWGSILTRLL